MKSVDLDAPLTRGRREFDPGTRLDLPAELAGKLVDRGRARLSTTGGVAPALLPSSPPSREVPE
jgi:hypothetical protein